MFFLNLAVLIFCGAVLGYERQKTNKYRAKTRFARFYNLPELMAMFKEIADIKTADMLDLPVPTAVFHNISVKPSEIQKQMVAELAESCLLYTSRCV